MKFRKLGLGAVALASASVLLLAACSSGDTGATSSSGASGSASYITANGSEPSGPLLTTNINETGGGKVIDNLYAGLIYYDADGAPVNDMAESITTDDNVTFTIKVAEGNTFTNGEDVTAKSFVDAWQYGALLSNAQLNSYFFEPIAGFSYDEDSPLDITIVDDYTFTVVLNAPTADFPLRLGYSAFYPLPSVAYDDIDAYGEAPIGNGPYMLDGDDAWQHDVQITLKKNPDYTGGRAPQNDGLVLKFYASEDSAYSDLLSDNLDVLDVIPSASLTSFESDLGDRAFNQPAAIFQSFTIPSRLPHFSGPEGELRRAAISHAIDRESITKTIFNDTRTPAHDFTSPVIDGYSEDITGSDVLDYDEDLAKSLWAQADAIAPWDGTFEIAYNADSSHKDWVDATANSIKNVLGIDAVGTAVPTFDQFRTEITDRSIQSAFRTGWQADYPGLFNFLGPIYATNAGSNDGDYSNPAFDALLAQGSAAGSVDEANTYFQQAQEILFKDLPAIPLWYATVQGGHSTLVDNVAIDWHSVPLYYQITKK
ncbi:peptide ABC transporter substrate-binding protein [Naasia lichenicola]|uniref:ABC transporter substrate-binding protein n=1 Tax=Naasia lichenicola TaxID=2565933 RepID=A0A4S4FFG2_9MICO|nr:ABC transporter substrate-binding protein [Naasia lichenicola]THG28462.1 ABC transporter substrate-binding protein [Naasia lichenicola]